MEQVEHSLVSPQRLPEVAASYSEELLSSGDSEVPEVSEEQVEAKIAREREREKTLVAREETARAGAKDRSRVAPTAKPSAAKAPVAARPAGTRTGSSRR